MLLTDIFGRNFMDDFLRILQILLSTALTALEVFQR